MYNEFSEGNLHIIKVDIFDCRESNVSLHWVASEINSC